MGMTEPIAIPEDQRPVEFIVRQQEGLPPLRGARTLEAAREISNCYVVLEGDWGGTIYCTCPVRYVRADQAQLDLLAHELELAFWGCNINTDEDGTPRGGEGVFFHQVDPRGILGGMGGGGVIDGLWVHPALTEELAKKIEAALQLEEGTAVLQGGRHGD